MTVYMPLLCHLWLSPDLLILKVCLRFEVDKELIKIITVIA